MYILGISAYHGDCSACIIKDGQLLAAVEEERFRRAKHWAGFPSEAISYCLRSAGVRLNDVDYIVIGRSTYAHIFRKAVFSLTHQQGAKKLKERLANKKEIERIARTLASLYNIPEGRIKRKIHYVEHHKAHLASAYLVSPFKDAAVLSVDGFGDFVSCMMGLGGQERIKILKTTYYPHSIGIFYTAITQFLGFCRYGDEYKIMGLAPYGRPRYKDKFAKILRTDGSGSFFLDLGYFQHHSAGAGLSCENGEPEIGKLFSNKFTKEFGRQRLYSDDLTEYHKDIAASAQAQTEDVVIGLINHLYELTRSDNLCLAGGVAMNSVANGKVPLKTPFKNVYVQPAAGDAGTALGAAYYLYNSTLKNKRNFIMKTASWGPNFGEARIADAIDALRDQMSDFKIERAPEDETLCRRAAGYIADGMILGWFQGRMEWGPRALGNRSILADPREPEMKDILNARIKMREGFRPFAPSIIEDNVKDYFEQVYPVPFMSSVYKVRQEKREIIPAVTHVDGTGRLQTVSRRDQPLYWSLIKEFERLTDVPVILNTSFNENEPIVCTPAEALGCFLRTRMDVLVMGPYIIKK